MTRIMRIITLLGVVFLLPGISGWGFPATYIRLESGIGFSSFSDLNGGIDGLVADLQGTYGSALSEVSLSKLDFQIPTSVKLGMSPLWGWLAFTVKGGYGMARSWNKVTINTDQLTYNFLVDMIPLEIGIELTLFSVGDSVQFKLGAAYVYCSGKYTFEYDATENLAGVNLARYPQVYEGSGGGVTFSLTGVFQLSDNFGLFLTLGNTIASIDKLEGDIRQDDGSTRREQLFVQNGQFVSAPDQPADASPVRLDFSGPSLTLGVQFSFGGGGGNQELKRTLTRSLGSSRRLRVTRRGVTLNLGNILFAESSYTLKAAGKSRLRQVVRVLRQRPRLRARIEGHTDSRGDRERNKTLSRQRARSVYDYLRSAGIPSGRLSYHGYGQDRPLAGNNTEAGRRRNRRVEIVFRR